MESDFTVIGCCGCTEELFDHSTVWQDNTTNGKIQQETCVTVTLMKFFYQMTLLTGNPKYADSYVDVISNKTSKAAYPNIIEVNVLLKNEKFLPVTDYASALPEKI